MTRPPDVDVLVVGSGPAGTAFARRVLERAPTASVLVVDAGPRLDPASGTNTRNMRGAARSAALDTCRGPDRAAASGQPGAQPGTFLLRVPPDGADDQRDMPAAALSRNVGGMGAHWACACPPPSGPERVACVPDDAFDDAFARAARWLSVTTRAFPRTPLLDEAERIVSTVVGTGPSRPRPMPLACRPTGGLPRWTGTADLLDGSGVDPAAGPQVRGDTLCVRLHARDGRVTGAELTDLPSGTTTTVSVRVVAVAADALFTPALLWASGIRPAALGRGLNDQAMLVATVPLPGGPADPDTCDAEHPLDLVSGVTWVPYDADEHPFHGQITFLDRTPAAVLAWFVPKDVQADDHLVFGEPDPDHLGLPSIGIRYRPTGTDRARVAAASDVVARCAEALGGSGPVDPPVLLPSGSSLHYQGTVRMGDADDGTSVCDPRSRVREVENLYVAGNGVIPTELACNPTATSMALAVLAAEHAADAAGLRPTGAGGRR